MRPPGESFEFFIGKKGEAWNWPGGGVQGLNPKKGNHAQLKVHAEADRGRRLLRRNRSNGDCHGA